MSQLSEKKIKELLNTQISFKEEGRLLNQILETNKSYTYVEVLASLENFLVGLDLNYSS